LNHNLAADHDDDHLSSDGWPVKLVESP